MGVGLKIGRGLGNFLIIKKWSLFAKCLDSSKKRDHKKQVWEDQVARPGKQRMAQVFQDHKRSKQKD